MPPRSRKDKETAAQAAPAPDTDPAAAAIAGGVADAPPEVDDAIAGDDGADLDTERFALVAIDAGLAGRRLDGALAEALPDISRSRLKALIEAGHVRLTGPNGGPLPDPSRKTKSGDVVEVSLPAPVAAEPQPEAIPLDVVFEDEHLIVIDKPAGLVVHPAAGHWSGTLVNALLYHCGDSLSGIGGVRRPGIVHRLDKDTTGLMVVAKSDAAHAGLAEQFADHGRTGALERAYQAVVWGTPEPWRGTINLPLGRSSSDRTRMAVVRKGGKEAITHYEVLERFPTGAGRAAAASLVECRLETGRTHQIRVHLAELGHPLLGDQDYARGFLTKANRLPEPAATAVREFPRQALHAFLIAFDHPVTGEFLRFERSIPQDMKELMEQLQQV
ncbi:RluA family pseudouridine synthase [Methylobrevis albus]|uniref:Pseudouridine synthase n=1 Tax=Methylobrevis albus TaxID=2793297 RepID=A0A931I5F3_9HYPH|nr:RluA family pseudouridine synthase [Methylobrevis albus]MBH0239555.1 RluA family pseudouridine synthase [Methylobrevis albus]